MAFMVTTNIPGCLPTEEPFVTEDFDEAVQVFHATISEAGDGGPSIEEIASAFTKRHGVSFPWPNSMQATFLEFTF